jgi:hypothetical protein
MFWQREALKNPNQRGADMPAIARTARAAGFTAFIVQVHQGADPAHRGRPRAREPPHEHVLRRGPRRRLPGLA